MPIYDAAMQYQAEGVPLVVIAGKEYGSGSSRDWAAKGTMLLGVKAVIAESYERIHRSNLVNMGVLPLQFKLTASRRRRSASPAATLRPRGAGAALTAARPGQRAWPPPTTAPPERFEQCAASTRPRSSPRYRHGGILPYVLRQLVSRTS